MLLPLKMLSLEAEEESSVHFRRRVPHVNEKAVSHSSETHFVHLLCKQGDPPLPVSKNSPAFVTPL